MHAIVPSPLLLGVLTNTYHYYFGSACNSIVEYEMCIAIGAIIAIKSIMFNVSFSPSRIESIGVMLIMLIRRIKQVL